MTRVSLTRQAQRDIVDAAEWYENRKEGLGEEFLDRVQGGLDRIELNPLGYAKVRGENRRANLDQFPYALWYKIDPEDGSIVIACLHGKRSPRLAVERALGTIEMKKPEP